jgi:hypothetical protein
VLRALQSGAAAFQRTWRAFLPRAAAHVTVLITDHDRARVIQRQLRAGLRSLRHDLGTALRDDLRVVAQQTLAEGQPADGYYEFLRCGDRGYIPVVRLALVVDGKARAIDDVLATMTNQCFDINKVGRHGPFVWLVGDDQTTPARADAPIDE